MPNKHEQAALKTTQNARGFDTGNVMKCFLYKKTGHLKKKCHKYIAWKKKYPTQNSHNARIAIQENNYDEELSFQCFGTNMKQHGW